jgi:hypothetical protein
MMTCLVHHNDYRSIFHGVVNELRKEKLISASLLRTMPRKSCTCQNNNEYTDELVKIGDSKRLTRFEELRDKVTRNRTTNPALMSSLKRLEVIIEQCRLSSTMNMNECHKNDCQSDAIDTNRTKPMSTRKATKSLSGTGTFLFLPYRFEKRARSNGIMMEDIKRRQCGRFISRTGCIGLLQSKYRATVSMITPTTSAYMRNALKLAKQGEGNIKIQPCPHDESQHGEWFLVRAEKNQKELSTTQLTEIVDELTRSWTNCANIHKRSADDERNSKTISVKRFSPAIVDSESM